MLTLRELRSMVSETYEGRVISKKRLQESNEKIVVKEKLMQIQKSVFMKTDWFYISQGRITVYFR